MNLPKPNKAFGLALAAMVAGALPAQARTIAIHAGTLIDGTGRVPQRTVSILIEDERITDVVDGFVRPEGVEVIDLSGATVLPGLIDGHDHISNTGDRQPINRFFLTEGDAVVNAVLNARIEVETGFTTVRDLGSGSLTAPALTRAIKAGRIMGPRIFSAMEPIGPTGGHSDPANGTRPDIEFHNRDYSIADGADAVIEQVRSHHRRGATVIKIYPSGGVASIGDDPQAMTMTVAEMTAAVETAHALGMTVAAHAHGTKAINQAVLAGVDSIEHGTYANEESYALMKQHGTFLVPTLLVGNVIYKQAVEAPQTLPPTVADKAKAVVPLAMRNFANAYRAGVKIAFGTDQGALGGRNKAEEFALMVKAGMTPRDAILSATRNGADLLRMAQDIGSIQRGRYADIIAVQGDPLADIAVLQQVRFVMKSGAVIKTQGASGR
jgi:imidazolonepropionase-like amidohydrolase